MIPADACRIEALRTKQKHTSARSQPFPDQCSLPLAHGRGLRDWVEATHQVSANLRSPGPRRLRRGLLAVPEAQHPQMVQMTVHWPHSASQQGKRGTPSLTTIMIITAGVEVGEGGLLVYQPTSTATPPQARPRRLLGYDPMTVRVQCRSVAESPHMGGKGSR